MARLTCAEPDWLPDRLRCRIVEDVLAGTPIVMISAGRLGTGFKESSDFALGAAPAGQPEPRIRLGFWQTDKVQLPEYGSELPVTCPWAFLVMRGEFDILLDTRRQRQ